MQLPSDAQLLRIFIGESDKCEGRPLYEEIVAYSLAYAIAEVDAGEIDRVNILNATRRAMAEAVAAIVYYAALQAVLDADEAVL